MLLLCSFYLYMMHQNSSKQFRLKPRPYPLYQQMWKLFPFLCCVELLKNLKYLTVEIISYEVSKLPVKVVPTCFNLYSSMLSNVSILAKGSRPIQSLAASDIKKRLANLFFS